MTRIEEKWFTEITQGMTYFHSGQERGSAFPLAFCKNHQGSVCLHITTSVDALVEAI